jgi:clan AA aspartic protease (TIGR02281 family)
MPNGKGVATYSNSDVFEGTFKYGYRHGEGVLTYAKGGHLKGIWINGEYISGSEEGNYNLIKLKKDDGGVYNVKVIVNGMEVNMILDTGAAMVNLTSDFLLPMYRNGKFTEDDVVGGSDFIDANGDVNYQAIINIREMNIGNVTLENVKVAVAPEDGINLFGLNAIQKLGDNISIDFKTNELRYYSSNQ